jgi:hypothetical protein
MLALGGEVVLRSNWRIYCEEFELSLSEILRRNKIPGLDSDWDIGRCDSQDIGAQEEQTDMRIISDAMADLRADFSAPCEMELGNDLEMGQMIGRPVTTQYVQEYATEVPITHFETKFSRAGVPLYEVRVQLGERCADEVRTILDALDKQNQQDKVDNVWGK